MSTTNIRRYNFRGANLNLNFTMFATGLIAIGTALPFTVQAYGPTESEVTLWGKLILFSGFCSLIIGMLSRNLLKRQYLRTAVLLGYGLLAIAQIPPIILWILFNGQPMPDNIPPTDFTVNWIYSIPHVLLFGASLRCGQLLHKVNSEDDS